LTDDPDTPGPGYWEINTSVFLEKNQLGRKIETPRLDLNYGVGERIQLKFEVPWVMAWDTEEKIRTGTGKANFGVKWRFLGQEKMKLSWSIYPQFHFNPVQSSITKGLVEEGYQMLFPTEITVELAHVEINGEVGRNFVEHGPGNWIYGLSTEGNVSPRLELLAEVHGETFPEQPTELIVNVGARRKLTSRLILLMALGRAVRGGPERPDVILYAGLQINLPRLHPLRQADSRRPGSAGPPPLQGSQVHSAFSAINGSMLVARRPAW
jgi:hypothetical protein